MSKELEETLKLMRSKKKSQPEAPRNQFDDDNRHVGSFESHGKQQRPKDPPPPK